MPQATQGSGYSLQSFLKKNQKRISTAIPHAKPIAVKKMSVILLPWPPKPDGTDADKELLFFSSIAIGRRNSGAEPNRRTTNIAFQKNYAIRYKDFMLNGG
ncbi:hypothetical protein ASU31_06435 [Pedobacter ginsenosidimutans]|uniref:Uncharacterized protein n=2 Tax=Pedobacter ginsenosidimutans TaxID=687842 RepID=A0A0T5VTV4_9SPHI|nr:hypothetical protein ASU31_06435 [Pedobacter ginsenosidimutans]